MMNTLPKDRHVNEFIALVKTIYGEGFIPLHRPVFSDEEKQYTLDCIDSNFVSSAGKDIEVFEQQLAQFTGAKFAIATVNGTAALHTSLHLAGVTSGTQVVTQALSFVATANAISYCGAKPVFLDIEKDTLGLCPNALRAFLQKNAELRHGQLYNRKNGARLSACVPMHSYGHPARIEEIAEICSEFGLPLVEDSAESLGSYSGDIHTGRFGALAAFSFNGNKIITTGGGGMVTTDDEDLAARAKHITTTAKQPHAFEYYHDEIGFNYRMPNLNAALGKAQIEKLQGFLKAKRVVAEKYKQFFATRGANLFWEREGTRANFWLNCVLCSDLEERNQFIKQTNDAGVMTRPVWQMLNTLPMYQDCQTDGLVQSKWVADRLVNIPSSVPQGEA